MSKEPRMQMDYKFMFSMKNLYDDQKPAQMKKLKEQKQILYRIIQVKVTLPHDGTDDTSAEGDTA